MKPEEEPKTEDASPPSTATVEGDVIGNTAYSQRFVLKLLLKIANLETLQEAITHETSFEDNLCVLWDMTTDKDVVLYLQENNALRLLQFALPAVTVPRIMEIMIGIIGNMCCHAEVIEELMQMETFLDNIVSYTQLFDTGILSEVFRLVGVCMYKANETHISIWLNIFKTHNFSNALYFTLKNSSNKDLLLVTLEGLNTICASVNNKNNVSNSFSTVLVTSEAVESLSSAFREIVVTQREVCSDDEIERICNITIQIILYLASSSQSNDVFSDSREEIANIVLHTIDYYKSKYVEDKVISDDLEDISEAVFLMTQRVKLCQLHCSKFVTIIYDFWKILHEKNKAEEDKSSWDAIEESKDVGSIIKFLGKTICYYIEKSSEYNLHKLLDIIVKDLDDIVSSIQDESVKDLIEIRTSGYVSRIKENNDS